MAPLRPHGPLKVLDYYSAMGDDFANLAAANVADTEHAVRGLARPAESLSLGIAWRVSDSPLEDALAYAPVLAGQPSVASAAIRRILYQGLDTDLETQLLAEEPRVQGTALHSAEFRERFADYRASITSQPQSRSH